MCSNQDEKKTINI
jgi:hypothetical protein